MCVDYTVLNKHCPKDPFGLPCIDQIVDSIERSTLLSFLDFYSRYHQIALKKKIRARHLSPLRSAPTATKPCRLDSRMLVLLTRELSRHALGSRLARTQKHMRTTKNPDTLIEDLKQIFKNLKKWKWKLNPNKCGFGVPSGKLHGFLVSHRGI
jgi:hypothetical protein